ncbi:MAG: CDP-2,3-bis-(O-geranylgeranyl)-sn-glycerol synthase [Candidatus Micrarchaeota archaeon]
MDLLSLFLFALPAYIANGAPVLFGGGRPIDGGRSFADGRRILGASKTVRGFFSGFACGLLTSLILGLAVPGLFLPQFGLPLKLAAGMLLSLGAMVGDLLGSFAKRRMGVAPGEPFFLTDQLLFFACALAFCAPLLLPPYEEILVLFVLTFALHVLSNFIAHRLRLKAVPW